jgi:hypothetical protein
MKLYTVFSHANGETDTVYGIFDEEDRAKSAARKIQEYTGETIVIEEYELNSMKSFYDEHVNSKIEENTPAPESQKDISWT